MVMQGVLHSVRCTMRFHGWGAAASKVRVRYARATSRGRVQLKGVCMRSRHGAATAVRLVSLGSATGCAVQEGGQLELRGERCASGSMQQLRRSVLSECCAARPVMRSPPRSARLGQTLGCPPHSTAQSAACSLLRGASKGGPRRREPDARGGCRGRGLLCSASPWDCAGGAWLCWGSAHREMMKTSRSDPRREPVRQGQGDMHVRQGLA